MQLPVRGCLHETRDPGNRSTALLHCDRRQRLHHCAMPSKAKTRIPALDPPNWWENFVKIVDPITLTQEKLFSHTFNLLENTRCALAKNLHSRLASPLTALRFYIGGVAGTTGEPSRVGWDAQVDHMGISLRPSSCSSMLPWREPSLVFSALQHSSSWRQLSYVHFFGTLCCQDTEWCKSSWQLRAGTPQGLICCKNLPECNLYVIVNGWTHLKIHTLHMCIQISSHASAVLFTVHFF